MLYDAKLLFADQKRALELDSRVGSTEGQIDYSLLLDGLMAEREQGITIDVAYRYFTTKERAFIVADTPGHEEYTRNMAVGASFADLAVILIDATKGVLSQTKRHMLGRAGNIISCCRRYRNDITLERILCCQFLDLFTNLIISVLFIGH